MYGYTVFHKKTAMALIDSVRNDSVSQAYIFEGAKGMFKGETARLFANALVCENSDMAPCGECQACREARLATCPDIITVPHSKSADGKFKKTIGVDVARDVCADAQKKPYGERKKVYIVPDGENFTAEAQNAFLKTLEEPPEYAVFIIIVPSSEMLLNTVVSRCSMIRFGAVSYDDIRAYIAEKYPQEKGRADFIAKYCGGTPGAAEEMINDDEFEEIRNKSLALMPCLLSTSSADAFKIRDFLDENKDRAQEIYDIWLSFVRDLSVIQCGDRSAVINSDKIEKLTALCARCDLKRCINGAALLTETMEMLKSSVKISAAALRLGLKF